MPKRPSSAAVLVDPESRSRPDAMASMPRIGDLFRIAQRYLRSVHLERDYDNTPALQHYVVTPPIVAVFSRIVEGLHAGSGHRAWRITGDYGTGKSSFALMLARLLCDPDAPALQHVHQAIAQEIEDDVPPPASVHMIPVLVTGARESLVPAVARAVGQTLGRLHGQRHTNQLLKELRRHSAAVAQDRRGITAAGTPELSRSLRDPERSLRCTIGARRIGQVP